MSGLPLACGSVAISSAFEGEILPVEVKRIQRTWILLSKCTPKPLVMTVLRAHTHNFEMERGLELCYRKLSSSSVNSDWSRDSWILMRALDWRGPHPHPCTACMQWQTTEGTRRTLRTSILDGWMTLPPFGMDIFEQYRYQKLTNSGFEHGGVSSVSQRLLKNQNWYSNWTHPMWTITQKPDYPCYQWRKIINSWFLIIFFSYRNLHFFKWHYNHKRCKTAIVFLTWS